MGCRAAPCVMQKSQSVLCVQSSNEGADKGGGKGIGKALTHALGRMEKSEPLVCNCCSPSSNPSNLLWVPCMAEIPLYMPDG